MKITAADRAAVAASNTKSKMSDAAKTKLRCIDEHDKINQRAEEQFVAAFQQLPKDVPAMRHVLRRIFPFIGALHVREHRSDFGDEYSITRMAQKLLAGLTSGLCPQRVIDVALLAELTPDELRMTDDAFEKELAIHAGMRHRVNGKLTATDKHIHGVKRGSLEEKQRRMLKRSNRSTTPALAA